MKSGQAFPRHHLVRLLTQALRRSMHDAADAQTQVLSAAKLADELELRIREVDHRAKNSLQLAAAMLQMQARASGDPRVADPLHSATMRLHTLADIHARLYRAEDHETLAMRSWLTQVCDGVGADSAVSIHLATPEVVWPVSMATPVGLFVAEAVANARKHAFGPAGGRIEVGLVCIDDGGWCLSVADDGAGLSAASVDGLGLKLLDVFARQLDGTLVFDTGLDGRGLRASLRFAALMDGPEARRSEP